MNNGRLHYAVSLLNYPKHY